MQPRVGNYTTAALTKDRSCGGHMLSGPLLVHFVFANFFGLGSDSPGSSYGLTCINNLKEISLGYRVWAGDNNGKYPMEESVSNGGTMEFAESGDVVKTFQIMSTQN